jgi:hypothetical protein
MKRIAIIISILEVITLSIYSQNQYDALITSREINSGTARYIGMGGAFGSLGGDLSVASTNPAGLAILRNSILTVTPGIYNNTSTSRFTSFNNYKNEDFEYRMTLDNIGYVWASHSGGSEGWVSTAFGFGYNKLNDYNQRILIGPVISNDASLADWFTDIRNDLNYPVSNFYIDYYENPVINADIVYGDDTTGFSNDFRDAGYGQSMEKSIIRYGKKGEYFISFAANYSNILYIGGTFGIQSFNYDENQDHFESDINNNSDIINSFNFREYTEVNGTGYTFKLGILARPVEYVRLGVAYHLPVTYKLNYTYYTNAAAVFETGDPLHTSAYSPERDYDYKVLTPQKAIFSLGFILAKYGILSIGYEWVDYTKMKVRSDDDSFSDVNADISNQFQTGSNLRTGLEIRLGTISLRGGYTYYSDPFTAIHDNSGQDINVFSGGIGLNSKNYFLDLGVMNYTLHEDHYLYSDYSSKINSNLTKILFTIGFRF